MAQENDPRQTVTVNHHGTAALGSETLVDVFFWAGRRFACCCCAGVAGGIGQETTNVVLLESVWKDSEGADRDGTLRLRRSTLDGADN